jgi:hypothetical protein
MPNECQISKRDSEASSGHSYYAGLVSASHLNFGFYLNLELWYLTF